MDEKRNNDGGSCLIIILGVILFLFLWGYVLSTPAHTAVFTNGVYESVLPEDIYMKLPYIV